MNKTMNIKRILIIVMISFAFSACTIKQNDSLFTKAIKHTINSPIYVAGAASTIVVGAVGVGVVALEEKKEKKLGDNYETIGEF